MANYTIEIFTFPEIRGRLDSIYSEISNINSVINTVFGPILYINFFFILLLSTSWGIYLVRKLMKDYTKEKLKSKLRMSMEKDVWENSMDNFKSNRIKNIFLLVICLSEIGTTISAIAVIAYFVPQEFSNTKSIQSALNTFKETDGFSGKNNIDYLLGYFLIYRIGNAFTIMSQYSTILFVRILTQYMVHQYSYYKLHLNMKIEIIVSLYIFLPLFIMGTVEEFICLFPICIILAIFRDFILLFIENKKLCLSLKQRLNDAILHENQPEYVIRYYKLAYHEYKYSSRIFLFGLLLQIMGLSIYCILPVVMAIVQTDFYIYDPIVKIMNAAANSLELVLLTLGTSLQIILYLIVSLRRLFRNVFKKIRQTRDFTANYHAIQALIKRNQSAYVQNN